MFSTSQKSPGPIELKDPEKKIDQPVQSSAITARNPRPRSFSFPGAFPDEIVDESDSEEDNTPIYQEKTPKQKLQILDLTLPAHTPPLSDDHLSPDTTPSKEPPAWESKGDVKSSAKPSRWDETLEIWKKAEEVANKAKIKADESEALAKEAKSKAEAKITDREAFLEALRNKEIAERARKEADEAEKKCTEAESSFKSFFQLILERTPAPYPEYSFFEKYLDILVEEIANRLEKLCEKNAGKTIPAAVAKSVALFNWDTRVGSSPAESKSPSLRQYLLDLSRYFKNVSSWAAMLLLLIEHGDLDLGGVLPCLPRNIHKLALTCFSITDKFDDAFYTTKDYALAGQIPFDELKKLEVEFLFSTDFRIGHIFQNGFCSNGKLTRVFHQLRLDPWSKDLTDVILELLEKAKDEFGQDKIPRKEIDDLRKQVEKCRREDTEPCNEIRDEKEEDRLKKILDG